ncbi:MAG: DJ-1/PfpI family protein [Candidatus Latescibacteria bacterium]|nr:DJ-1/PfpI family protein [Candidatus Latescibacterota bacterium]
MKKVFIVQAVLLLAVICVFQTASAQQYPAPLKGKKIAIFLDQQYQIDEAWYTPLRLKEAGADVKIVSHYSPVVSRDFHTVKTDIKPSEALKIQWDGVVVIGGFSPLEMRECKDVINIIQEVNNRNGMISAICHGVCVLVTADIIRGKTVTGNVPRQVEFKNAGATYIEQAPQIDGNIITAIGPGDNGPYLDAIINWFHGGESSAKAHLNDQYLKGKKIAVVFDQRYDYDQAKYPFVRFRQNGADVYYIASADGEYTEYRHENKIKADYNAQDALNERFDALILLSHWAADTYRRNADIRQFVSKNLNRGTLVASVNWGHAVLIETGDCKGRKIATTWGMQNDIKNAGGTPVLQPVVQDGNLMTCATDDDMPALMRYVTGYLMK